MRTYGTIHHDAEHRKFIVECEPHVSLRFKRVFGCVSGARVSKFQISATTKNACDLLWFNDRYPLKAVGCGSLINRLAQEGLNRMNLVETLMGGRGEPRTFDLALPLRIYQGEAVSLALASGGLLIADEVGLGKTACGIGMFTDARTLPAVVVTLTHLPRQWREEIHKFAPKLNTHIITKGQPYDLTKYGIKSNTFSRGLPDVVIMSYSKLGGWAETLAKVFKSVVFDESQELRRRGEPKKPSIKYFAARHLSENVDFRMGLTATPIYNYGGEMFNVVDCISPDALGTRDEFCTEWCNGNSDDKAVVNDPKALGYYLREQGIMLRRTRKDVGRELPKEQRITQTVEADTLALDRIKGNCVELAKLILQSGQDFTGQKMQAAGEFDRALRQATGIGKAPYVAEFVKMLVEEGQKVIVFAWHRAVYALLMEALKEYGPRMYTGSESPREKDETKSAFINDPACKILLMSLRAGAGTDGLQDVCTTVVFAELDWSPGVVDQDIGRVRRDRTDGHANQVFAYFLLCDQGSDPAMVQVLGLKENQAQGIIDPDAAVIEKLQIDPDHIKKLARSYLSKQAVSRIEQREEVTF